MLRLWMAYLFDADLPVCGRPVVGLAELLVDAHRFALQLGSSDLNHVIRERRQSSKRLRTTFSCEPFFWVCSLLSPPWAPGLPRPRGAAATTNSDYFQWLCPGAPLQIEVKGHLNANVMAWYCKGVDMGVI